MAICAPSPTAGRTKDAISANIHIGGNRTPIHPSTLIASAQGLRRFFAITPGIAATTKIRNNTPTTKIARIASDTTSRTSTSTCPVGFHARFPARDFAHLAGAVDTADWRAIGSAVPGNIEIRNFARRLQKLRIRRKGEPCNGIERSRDWLHHGKRSGVPLKDVHSSAPAITACSTTAGHNRTPRNAVPTATRARKMAAPVLKTKRPNAAVPPDPGLVEPKLAIPRANSAMPANRPIGAATPIGAVANSNSDATLSATTSVAPTMISSHAANLTTEFFRTYILHLTNSNLRRLHPIGSLDPLRRQKRVQRC